MMQVTQIRNTQLMELHFTTLEPELSRDLANALAQQYIVFHSESETTHPHTVRIGRRRL